MTTKYGDASSIVGDEWAAKLEEYERKLNRRKHKSEAAEDLILKAVHRNRVLDLVRMANITASVQRANRESYSIAHGPGSWNQKVKAMQSEVQSFINDLQEAGVWDDNVRRAVHRGVHRLKKQAEVAHTVQMVQSSLQEARAVKAMVDDLRMRRVLGLR